MLAKEVGPRPEAALEAHDDMVTKHTDTGAHSCKGRVLCSAVEGSLQTWKDGHWVVLVRHSGKVKVIEIGNISSCQELGRGGGAEEGAPRKGLVVPLWW